MGKSIKQTATLQTVSDSTALSATYAPVHAAPTTAVVAGIFDRVTSAYNLKPSHLRRTRAAIAKARAGTAFFRVAALGDSTVAGAGATGMTAWPVFYRSMLATNGIPSAGTGLVSCWHSTFVDSRWVFGAGWGAWTGAATARINSTTANPATLTSDTPGTIARVYYNQVAGAAGAFTVSIDGATAVTVTPSGANSMGVYEVTGLANTTHSIAVVRTGTGNVYLFGAEVRSSATSGVLLYNGGLSGQIIATIGDANWYSTGTFAAGTATWNSDLIFIMCETNDSNNSLTPVATYKNQFQSAITVAKAQGADVVLVTAVPSSGITFGPYTQALYELADTNNLPLIDLQDRLGSYALSNSYGLMADLLHPNAAGYAEVGSALFTALK